MFRNPTIFFLYLWLLPFYLQSQESNDVQQQDCVQLDIPIAITRVLNYNRSLINTFDSKIKSEYAVILAQSVFDISINPNSRAGYVGGGTDGLGMSVGGGIDISKRFVMGTSVVASPSVLKTPEHYHANLRATISQPLLRGFGKNYQLSRLRGAQFALRSACRSLFAGQVQLTIRTIQALYEVIKAEKTMELNKESYARVNKFYQTARLKAKINISDGLDIYRAEIELNQAEDNLVSSRERLQEAEDVIRDILSFPLDVCLKIDLPLIHTVNEMTEEEAIKLALSNRIEMEQAEDLYRENYRVSTVSKENLFPDINLVFDYSNCGRNEIFTRACTSRRESKWGIGFTTSGEYDPTGDKMAYDESLMAVSSAERGLEQTKSNISLEVKRSLRMLQRTYKKIALQEEQIKTSQGQLYLAQLKFTRNMANNFDVLQAEKSLRSSLIAYCSAVIDHIVGEYNFLAATGLLTDKPCIN